MIEPVDIEKLRPKKNAFWDLMTVDLGRKPTVPEIAFPRPRAASPGVFSSGRGTDLAIDFGTSAIAAALVGGSYAVEVLHFGAGERLLPAPFARRRHLDRSLLADNYELTWAYLGSGSYSGQGDPDEEDYPCLKRRIEYLARCSTDTAWQREAVIDVAAVCELALSMARDSRGRPLEECLADGFQIYITVPNAFPSAAIDVLRRGVAFGTAAALGLRERPKVRALLEAEAVAYGTIVKPALGGRPQKTTLLVLDAGAGTTDASIVRAEDGELRVVAHVGLPVGGMDLDAYLAALKGTRAQIDPSADLSQWLVTARQAKQHHLGERDQTPQDGFRGLARELVKLNDWPTADAGGKPIAEGIAGVYERYLALAVRSLIRALPADEVSRVDQLVVSGRSSLLNGFRDMVKRTVAEVGPMIEPLCADDPEDRKLAVVRGVGAYVSSTYGTPWQGDSRQPDRRPARASFEIFLRHEGDHELTLLPAGHALVQGWGVAAWYQPLRDLGRGNVRPRVEMRLVPRDVLRDLAAEGAFEEHSLEDLMQWSVLPVLRIDDKQPPYAARLAFDFLSLEAQLEVEGRRIRDLDRPESSFGRRHPVHQLEDNWFELLQRR